MHRIERASRPTRGRCLATVWRRHVATGGFIVAVLVCSTSGWAKWDGSPFGEDGRPTKEEYEVCIQTLLNVTMKLNEIPVASMSGMELKRKKSGALCIDTSDTKLHAWSRSRCSNTVDVISGFLALLTKSETFEYAASFRHGCGRDPYWILSGPYQPPTEEDPNDSTEKSWTLQ